MRFDLNTPCKNCPFRTDATAIRFACRSRAEEIEESAYRYGFPCIHEAEMSDAGKGWLPIALCPTDGVWRTCLLPDGSEVVASFEGEALGRQTRRWRVKEFLRHNPQRPTGEKHGGVEQMSTPYDTFLIKDLAEGVYPTHFRPNDTVYGITHTAPGPAD